MEPKELIKRYAHEVARQLPRKQQADVQAELMSLLQETLEARAQASGRPIDDALAVDVLREFGEPGEVARRYGPANQYLIGPAYYPFFAMVMRIVAIVLICVFPGLAILTFLTGKDPAANPASILLGIIPQLMSALVSAFGSVVLVFVIMERFGAKLTSPNEPWDPRALPEVEDPNRISRGEQIVTIVFSSLALVLFNLFPNWLNYMIPYYREWSGEATLLAPTFFTHLPWFNIAWLLEIGLALLILREGRWSKLTRWFHLGTSIFGGVIVYRMITGGALLSMPLLDAIVKGSLMIALVVVSIEAAVQLYRLVTGHNPRPFSGLKPTSAGS